jgi:hypothetical protein
MHFHIVPNGPSATLSQSAMRAQFPHINAAMWFKIFFTGVAGMRMMVSLSVCTRGRRVKLLVLALRRHTASLLSVVHFPIERRESRFWILLQRFPVSW